MYFSPLCDIDVFQEILVPYPGQDEDAGQDAGPEVPRMHRSCPPAIQEGYAEILSPPIPLGWPVPEGEWEVRAEAMTQDRKRIFCVQGTFNVTK